MTADGTTALPQLAPGDVYLYAHANGGIVAIHGDRRAMDLTLDDALATARRTDAGGGRVIVAGDDAPLAVDVLTRLGRHAGVPLEPFAAPRPPQTWPEGSDALISAAAHGADRILDDLVARGADVHHRADDGSTALHHAAAAGNLHAIGALVDAGAGLDATNSRGATPLRLAEGRGHPEAADLLRSLGAAPTAPRRRVTKPHPGPQSDEDGVITFRRSHMLVAGVWLVPPLMVAVLLALAWREPAAWVVAGVLGVLYAVMVPPMAQWVGGGPRHLDGTRLTLRRPWGTTTTIDLDQVVLAGAGGSTNSGGWGGGRWVLLAHPDGAKIRRGTLRRLLVPEDDRPVLEDGAERLVAVAVDGSTRAEVLLALGAVLEERRVPMTRTLTAQIAQVRTEAVAR